MIFYEIEVKTEERCENVHPRKENNEFVSLLSTKSESFFRSSGENTFIFPYSKQGDRINFGAILKKEQDPKAIFRKFCRTLPIKLIEPTFEEITYHTVSSRLSQAERNHFIEEKIDVLGWFELDNLEHYCYDFKFGENLVSENVPKEDHLKNAAKYLFKESFAPELERITTPSPCKIPRGHPVHYLIRTDSKEGRKEICRSLLSALYDAKRIQGRRYAFCDCRDNERLQDEPLAALYTACVGGAVIIRLEGAFAREGGFASRGRDNLKKILAVAEANKNKVLTIFCAKKSAEFVKSYIYENWSCSPLIELCEGVVSREDAIKYLKSKAKDEKIHPDKALTDAPDKEALHFSGEELDRIFLEWYDQKLRTNIYPQYQNCKTTKAKIKEEKIRGTAYEKLKNMIGLTEAKNLIDKAISYFKMQKVFTERGFASTMPSMHMVFTGNPGTAKTTVARLFSEIMKDNGLLPSGTLHEVGRADLVGQYVGSTAPLVKEAFERAKGGVLFIDEAYSLVDHKDGLFGDEAINAITQEMENNRHDTVVIFAGYPDKMEGFLKKNPGMRSRIAFHLNFNDYTAEELCDITDFIANQHGLTVEKAAREKICAIFEEARRQSDFGNGRFARNLVEKAKMAQAQRLMQKDIDCLTDKDLRLLLAEDFEAPTKKSAEILPIGFIA